MKEWLKGFMLAYNDYCIDTMDARSEDQFITDCLRNHPLPLPSDEEIWNEAQRIHNLPENSYKGSPKSFIEGAKWCREKMEGKV